MSSLLSDMLIEQDYMTEILSKMEENRDENKKNTETEEIIDNKTNQCS
jgi:hypothetical protein